MKVFVVLSALFAASLAAPQTLIAPALIAASPLVSKYHSQDSLGQYAYGYNDLTSSKVETKTIDGVTRGSYSYIDGAGKLQTVRYSADALNGFRVDATNLPKAPEVPKVELPIAPIDDKKAPEPVMDTAEVMMAKAEHMRLMEAEKMRKGPVDIKMDLEPVKDTPEVAFAKAEHLRIVEAEKLRGTLMPELAISRIAPIAPIAPIVAPLALPLHSRLRTVPSGFTFSTIGSPLLSRSLLYEPISLFGSRLL